MRASRGSGRRHDTAAFAVSAQAPCRRVMLFGLVWRRLLRHRSQRRPSLCVRRPRLESYSGRCFRSLGARLMASSARRPLTTYSRRHRPRKDPADDGTRSSPIRPLHSDAEDVTFAEMASRMNKRARQVAKSGSFETGDSELTSSSRPLKRRKPLHPDSDGGTGESDYMRNFIPASASGLCTPRLSVPSDDSMFPSSGIRPSGAPDRLSPLPPTSSIRNKMIRTSSRNYKENAMRSSSRRLASPFNSRPGSRANSPVHRKRPGHHVKSRTLSHSAALGEKVQDRNIVHSPSRPGILDSNPFPASHETKLASPNGKMAPSAHCRSSSTPSVKPALDSVSFEPWLVPPKHFPRSPPPSAATPGLVSDDKEKPAHLSFFLDAPMHISTPPQQQRATTTGAWAYGLMPQLDADPPPPVRTLHYDSDVDMSDSSLPGSPETNLGRPNHPRRRRRTIVHLPSDSLFSSCLDFSGVASETERLPRGPISEGSQSPAQDSLFHQLALEPAFSPTQSASNSLNKVRRGTSVSHGSSQSLDCPSAPGSSGIQVDPVSSVSSPGSGPPPSLARPDPGGDELLDLFSVMGLDGGYRHWLGS